MHYHGTRHHTTHHLRVEAQPRVRRPRAVRAAAQRVFAGLDEDGNGILDECQLDGFTYDWEVTDDWGTGFIANLTIHNDSGQCLSGWEALFNAKTFAVDSVWNGVLVPRGDGVIRIVNETWNGDVCQGESFTIGLQATGTPSLPVGLLLNDSPVEEAP